MADIDKVYILFEGGDDLRLACTTSISPHAGTEVTTNPVEEGADITDHVRQQPKTLQLDIFVSELDGQADAGLEHYDPYFVGDHITVRERLQQACDTGEPLHIDLGADKGIYPDMLILSMDPTWQPGQGKSLRCGFQLQQINHAETKTRQIAPNTRASFAAGLTDGAQSITDAADARLFQQGGAGIDAGFKPTIRPSSPRVETAGMAATGYPGVSDAVDWARGL